MLKTLQQATIVIITTIHSTQVLDDCKKWITGLDYWTVLLDCLILYLLQFHRFGL